MARLQYRKKNTNQLENKCLHFIGVDTTTRLYFYYIQKLPSSTTVDYFDIVVRIIKETSAVALS